MAKRTIEDWRRFVTMKADEETAERAYPTQMDGPAYSRAMQAVEKIEDEALRRRVAVALGEETKYAAVQLAVESLKDIDEDLAVEIAEAAAGLDYDAEVPSAE